ncbi:Chromosome partition protein smc [hydrothermal vent metagenome]|uniref:Chromosome partition protein smc n=1 Tax=hydrothermal vent metagenome TaxID=652676 RepID=A0A3B0WB14_9ZZZZ
MRLSKIKLAGFKSFVDSTEFLMTSNLIGVVGPNGCGKSNIIDAVRWVMGETSAKMLRGASMTDVIFSGSSTRKPVGTATVELIFDNSDGAVAGEFAQYSEISVKRLVSRDGQSKYYLNKTKCRKKDITDLFLGTGLGPRSYAIIEQGMISRIVESKPEELRGYIEEAAGISKYRERRRETERRIKRTRENLERLDDLRAEVGKHINHLQRQAKNAEKYKVLKQKFRVIEVDLLGLKWQKWANKTDGSNQIVTKFELALEQIKTSLTGSETHIDKQRIAHHLLQDKSSKAQEQLYLINTEIGKIEQFISHTKSLSQRLQTELQDTENAITLNKKQLSKDQQELEQTKIEYEKVQPELEKTELRLQQKQQAFTILEDELLEWQVTWNDLVSQISEKNRIVEVEKTKIASLDQQLSRQAERLQLLNQESSTASALPLEQELEQLQIQQEELQFIWEEKAIQLEETKQLQETKKQSLRQKQENLNQQQMQLHQAKGRKGSLQALQQAAISNTDEQAQTWFNTNDLHSAQKLSQLLEVDTGWEKAVETALGEHLQALVPTAKTSLTDAISSWKYGSLTIVENTPAQTAAKAGSLAEVIQGPEVLTEWFNNIFISEDLTTALKNRNQLLAGQAYITSDGVLVGKNWIKTSQGENEGGFLLRQKELKQLDVDIHKLETNIDNTVADIEHSRTEIAQLEQQKEQLQLDVNMGHRRVSECNAKVASKQHKITQIQQRNVQINTESEQLQVQIEIDEASVKTARAHLEETLAISTELQQQKQAQEQQQQDLVASKEQAKKSLAETSSFYYQQKLLLQSLEVKINSAHNGIVRLQQHCDKLDLRKTDLSTQMSQDTSPLQAKQSELQELLKNRIKTEQQRDDLRQQTQSCQTELELLERQRNDHNASIEHARMKLENARLEQQSNKLRTDTYAEQISEKGFVAKDVLANIQEGQNTEFKQNESERLQRSIVRLEPVNLAAISEYEEESKRKNYLDQQNNDLVEALTTLEKAIGKIDKETRTLFRDTFEAINTNIKILFPKLFGGGHCFLELTSDDLLTTGVSIMARPPGKRISNIQLLSGGEKALTAVAMVFAIFNLNPAPFCMLDEVDAPLDDANIGRFSKMLIEMSDRVQFLFVTHNKVTMEIANQLNGVTMREPGVSRLVSVDLSTAERMINS